MRFRLRTLLIVLAIGPMVLAVVYFYAVRPRLPDGIKGVATVNGDGTMTVVSFDRHGKLVREVRPVPVVNQPNP